MGRTKHSSLRWGYSTGACAAALHEVAHHVLGEQWRIAVDHQHTLALSFPRGHGLHQGMARAQLLLLADEGCVREGGLHHARLMAHLPDSYKRYLMNYFRKSLDVMGSPIRIQFKEGENPYANKRNTLTPTQMRKRKRLMKHIKKSK